jgi:hypothetical protein
MADRDDEARPAGNRTGPELNSRQASSSPSGYGGQDRCGNDVLRESGVELDPYGADRHRHCAICSACLPWVMLNEGNDLEFCSRHSLSDAFPPPFRCDCPGTEGWDTVAWAFHEHEHHRHPVRVRRIRTPGRASSPASVRRRLAGLLRTVNAATEPGRNTILHWAACRVGEMLACGELTDPDWAVDVLTQVGLRTGLHPREVSGTIRSGLRASGVTVP